MSLTGVYWSVMHRRAQDYEYFKRLQPTVFKIMDGGQPDYAWARDNLPNSLIIARDHSLSEQHADMLRDPNHTGQRHAEEWWNHSQRLGFDRAKTLVLGLNEPQVWQPGVAEALRQYTIALCDRAHQLGLRVGAMQLSVGWPANNGPDTAPDWSPFHGVEAAIKRGNHALICHEYWADNGPGENWGWWAGRSLKCPWQVPIVIGECGVDMYVKDGGVAHAQRGWRGRMEPERYARELAEYAGRMSVDPRFVGDCVFASDYANREWFSFDVEPAYQAILATPVVATKPQTQTRLPIVGTGPKPVEPPAYVVAVAGLNLRAAPVDGEVLIAIPYAEQIRLVGVEQNGWYRVRYGERVGYVAAQHIRMHAPEPLPAPSVPVVQPPRAPSSEAEAFDRSLRWVLKWEGGWADNPLDPGGATMKGVTIGTYTRWRQAHGQPTPTKAELRNISDAEVQAIYREWYWNESGANRLPWPMCLAVFNIAVNAGPGRAKQFMNDSGGNFLLFMATAMDWYTKIDGWPHFGAAWTRRNADLLREATK